MRILGPPSASRETVSMNLLRPPERPTANALFTEEIFPHLWACGLGHGVDPVGLVAQSILETGGGRFGGAISAGFCNPCGLKIRNTALFPGTTDGDRPLAHSIFPSWAVGALAHVQHVRAYAGAPLDEADLVLDPRYDWVVGRHRCEAWVELSGKWAPSPTYGNQVEALMRRISGG